MKPIFYICITIGLGFVAFHTQAMESEKQIISPSKAKAVEELELEALAAAGVFESPLKKSPGKLGKQEVESPSKQGFTEEELKQLALAGAFASPAKGVAATEKEKISPAGKFNVAFSGALDEVVDKSMEQGNDILATTFQIPNHLRIKAMTKPDTVFITGPNALEKDDQRIPANRELPKMAQNFKVYIFNPYKKLVGFNGRPVELHTKTFSWRNKHGKPRVSGFGSDNVTMQAKKNKEMYAYSKDIEDFDEHRAFAERIMPYCAEYNSLKNGTYKPNEALFAQKVDYRKLKPLELKNGERKRYTDQDDVEKVLMFMCKNAVIVCTYSIGDPYMAGVLQSPYLKYFIINKDNYNEKEWIRNALQHLVNTKKDVHVYVYDDPAGVNHIKEILTHDMVWFSEGNLTEQSQSVDLNKNTFTKDPHIWKGCHDDFMELLKSPFLREIKPGQSAPASSSQPPSTTTTTTTTTTKRRLGFEEGEEARTQTSAGTKRALFPPTK